MSAQPAAANNYGLPPVRKWLRFVDDQLSPDGVEFLKLGLYPDVGYKKMESIHKPSQLYDAILEQRPHEEKEVLRLFVHALRQIGGSLRGKFLTDSLPNYSLAMPDPLTSGETQTDFKFLGVPRWSRDWSNTSQGNWIYTIFTLQTSPTYSFICIRLALWHLKGIKSLSIFLSHMVWDGSVYPILMNSDGKLVWLLLKD